MSEVLTGFEGLETKLCLILTGTKCLIILNTVLSYNPNNRLFYENKPSLSFVLTR